MIKRSVTFVMWTLCGLSVALYLLPMAATVIDWLYLLRTGSHFHYTEWLGVNRGKWLAWLVIWFAIGWIPCGAAFLLFQVAAERVHGKNPYRW